MSFLGLQYGCAQFVQPTWFQMSSLLPRALAHIPSLTWRPLQVSSKRLNVGHQFWVSRRSDSLSLMNVNVALPDPKHNPYLAWTIGTSFSIHVEADWDAICWHLVHSCIARLMSFMGMCSLFFFYYLQRADRTTVYWRWCHFHGQRGTTIFSCSVRFRAFDWWVVSALTGARLDREQSVHPMEPQPRTLLISIFSPLFFFAPEVHLMEFEKIWTDEILNNQTWKPFINKLLVEWQEFVLLVCFLPVFLRPRVLTHAWFDFLSKGDSAAER